MSASRALAAAASRAISSEVGGQQSARRSTTGAPSTRRVSTWRGGPSTRAATGSAMPGVPGAVDAPERDVGELARLERADLVARARGSAPRGSCRAPGPCGRSSPSGRRAAGPPAGPGASPRPAPPTRWTPRRPRRARPRRRRRPGRPPGRCPRRAGAFDDGQCATEVPVAAKRAISSSARCTQWASQTSGPSQSRSSRYSTGRTPKRSRQKASSSTVSARWVCRRTPRRRASAAASRISSPVTENGEQGADRDPQHRPGRGVVPAVDRRLRGDEDGVAVLDDLVGRQPARRSARGPSSRGRGGSAGRGSGAPPIAAASRSPPSRGKQVVVVGGRGAAGQGERRQAAARGAVGDLLVDPGPDRVERGEPVEQDRVLREAAGRPLVEVVVAVDEAGRGQAAAAVDAPAALGQSGRRPAAEGRDDAAVDEDPALGVLGAGRVDRRDRAALDQERLAHPSAPSRAEASRTASRIFS